MECERCRKPMEQLSVVVRNERGASVRVTVWHCRICGAEYPCSTELVEEGPPLSEEERIALILGSSC